SEDSERDVRDALRTLGYAGDDIIRVVREATASAALVILYDLPSSRTELDALAASAPNQVVALVQPKQLTALAVLAGSERLSPFSLDASVAAARATDQRTRDELRSILEAGLPARELLTLEPLLGDCSRRSALGTCLTLGRLRLTHRPQRPPPRPRPRRARRAARRPVPPSEYSSMSESAMASRRAIWSAPSPTKQALRARASDASRSVTPTHSSNSTLRTPSARWRRSPVRTFAAGALSPAWTATVRR